MISSTKGTATRISAADELRQKEAYYAQLALGGPFRVVPGGGGERDYDEIMSGWIETIRTVISTQRSGMSDLSVINLQEVCLDIADMIAARVK